MKNRENNYCKKPLKDFESRLPKNFFRIHNSYVINTLYVKKLIKSDIWNIEMDNSEILPISRRKRTEFVQLMESVSKDAID
ncbi:MAG: LytTR family transcriptional regulator [Chloroflexia bacterium]|nr:LytTR family transcriptional regulator [Chloroflexia bacterium]